MASNLRKLKDEAAQLVQKNKLDKALKVYQQILELDPHDLTACLKCGDIYRKLDSPTEAIDCYTRVAEVYAADGLLLKAIAACKLIMEIDAEHTSTQTMLADLYAKKTGRAAAVAQAVAASQSTPEAAEPMEIDDDDIIIIEEDAPSQALPAIPLFSDLSKNAFIQLMEQMEMRTVLPGEAIIREGEVDDRMFMISGGKVKVTKTSDSGAEIVLAHLADGAFFGEMALLSEAPRSASVIAEEEALLFVVTREVLGQVVKNFPSVKHTLLRFYRQRLLSNLMATSPIFRPLDLNQRKSLIEKFKSREVPASEKILEEGQKGDGLYMLLSGKAEVSKKIDGKRQILAHLKEGDVFGEMSLLKNQPVGANVKTLRKSIVLKLPKRSFSEIVSTHPQLLAHISDVSSEREQTTAAIAAGKLHFSEEGLVVV
ncbi:MAG: cyclic nucleotide-binding domain-containing protein [Myxococcota bacterium]